MSTLVLTHVVTGLVGIASGLLAVAGIYLRKRMAWANAIFLTTTAASCGTGFAFLPTEGVTSAQLVSFFTIFLLGIAVFARYVRRLESNWNEAYALTAVGALFLDVLIATAQSFLHIGALRVLAPTQHSPIYVVVKFALLAVFIAVALVVSRRAGHSKPASKESQLSSTARML